LKSMFKNEKSMWNTISPCLLYFSWTTRFNEIWNYTTQTKKEI